MNKKESRPSWFKMFRNQKALIDSVPDAEVGQALKAVFQYFENGEVVEMSPLVFAVFSSVKPYVDESYDDFEDGKKGCPIHGGKGYIQMEQTRNLRDIIRKNEQ